jgi:uncharacterized protein YjbI with pentapeptide repeats
MTDRIVRFLREQALAARTAWRNRKPGWLLRYISGSPYSCRVSPRLYLVGEDLRGADLANRSLYEANLQGACLQEGRLVRTDLSGANLVDADLRGANLRDARLRRADLRGADLRDTDPTRAFLSGARYDDHTQWPEGFDPQAHGAVLVRSKARKRSDTGAA